MLTKNQRTHLICFKDDSRISITKSQYELYRDEVGTRKHNEFITIRDIDTDEILFEWRCNEIKEFKQRSFWTHTYNAICDFWARHPIREWEYNCECEKQWKYTGDKLKAFVSEKYNVSYPQDITIAMKKEFYDITKKEWTN